MKKILFLFILSVAFSQAGFAQEKAAEPGAKAVGCLIDPYIVHVTPVSLPIDLTEERVHGSAILFLNIDTTTDKIEKVYVMRAQLKLKKDGSDYLTYNMNPDFHKVETYPDKLKKVYPNLTDHAKGLKVERLQDPVSHGRYVGYSINVKIE